MGENSKIEWCDHTFNPWIGCQKVSAGCENCYAERDFDKRRGFAKWGPGGTRVVTSAANWRKPLKWHRQAMSWPLHMELCKQAGITDYLAAWMAEDEGRLPPPESGYPHRPRIFCGSLCDVFEDWQGEMSDSGRGIVRMAAARILLFDLIDATPDLDWLLLTKRPENIARMMPSYMPNYTAEAGTMNQEEIRQNVWIGTSVEDQAAAIRVETLRAIPAAVRFLSVEPMLGPLEIDLTGIHWVIAGGESGPKARPSHADWFRGLRDQCQAAGVPFFFKQFGEWAPESADQAPVKSYATFLPGGSIAYAREPIIADGIGPLMIRVGKKSAGRSLDGREYNEVPA